MLFIFGIKDGAFMRISIRCWHLPSKVFLLLLLLFDFEHTCKLEFFLFFDFLILFLVFEQKKNSSIFLSSNKKNWVSYLSPLAIIISQVQIRSINVDQKINFFFPSSFWFIKYFILVFKNNNNNNKIIQSINKHNTFI